MFLTRLHVRYDAEHFPEDLVFQETSDRTNFQGRYVLRHAWKGGDNCSQTTAYWKSLSERREQEAKSLALLTGWDIDTIRQRMNLVASSVKPPDEPKWWEKIWKKGTSRSATGR